MKTVIYCADCQTVCHGLTYKGHGLFWFEVHQSHPLGLTVTNLWLCPPWAFSQLLLSLQVFHFHLDQSSITCFLLFFSLVRRRRSMKGESNCCIIRKSIRHQYINSFIVLSFIELTTFLSFFERDIPKGDPWSLRCRTQGSNPGREPPGQLPLPLRHELLGHFLILAE